jgi:pimeloyl-ACP methyl ester carboxylesterase
MRIIGFIIGWLFFAHTVFGGQKVYDAFTVKVTGSGQPIILIPGATCSGDEWNETVAHYSARYQCHVLTLAGYAGTKPLANGPYLSQIQKQITQYISDQQLKDVTLVGHSIGGFLSLCLAADMRSNLKQVIVVDALPFFAGARNPNAADTFSTAMAEQMLTSYNGMSKEQMRAGQLQNAQFLCRDSLYWDRIADWGASSDKRTFAYTIAEMMGSDMRRRISAISVPVLVLAAYCAIPEYPMYNRQSVADLYTAQYKACTTCTLRVAADHAKHFIMYDTPEWYFSEIDNFIATK